MASRLAALLPRLVALTVIWLLAASTFTFAAGNESVAKKPGPKQVQKKPEVLIVPDVRNQAYVFAKGILEDGGFAYRVEGAVEGYAANRVVVQKPAPGVRVVDNGAPVVVLRLTRGEYHERGVPQNAAPYEGSEVVLPGAEKPAPKPAPRREAPARKRAKAKQEKGKARSGKREERKPDFTVPGAPPEPLDEMPLVERARLVQKRVSGQKPTNGLVSWWLYQHAWIVAGARFGWSGGADALRILIDVDRDMQARWGIGARSEATARRALAEVQAKAK